MIRVFCFFKYARILTQGYSYILAYAYPRTNGTMWKVNNIVNTVVPQGRIRGCERSKSCDVTFT